MDEFQEGDILQFKPDHYYSGQLMIVTYSKQWVAQGILCTMREYEGLTRYKGLAYVRAKSEEVQKVGHTNYIPGEENG